MNRDEYNKMFHKHQLNLVAFKRLMDCDEEVLRLVNAAIEAERERLAQPEVQGTHSEECWRWHHACAVAKLERLAQPEQEPVAWMEMVVANLMREGINKHKARELAQHFYASTPASKPWVGLTDVERIDLGVISEAVSAHSLIHMVEAKLKEKNA